MEISETAGGFSFSFSSPNMNSIPRKRRLSEFGTNISSPRGSIYPKKSIRAEENEHRFSHKCQRNSKRSDCGSTTDETLSEVTDFQDNSPHKLETIVELCESDSGKLEAEDKRNQENKIYFCDGNRPMDSPNYNEAKDILWYTTDYINDIISYEIYKESFYRLSENFCRKYDINPTGREILIDWLISVQVCVKAENSALHLAIALLDVLLDRVHVPLNGMQGAAIAAFWVAYKFVHGSLSMKTLLSFCPTTVTKSMIRDNEILVLQTSRLLEAGGSLTVFYNFLLYNIFGMKFPPEIYYCGLYFIEIMLLQFIFIDCLSYEKAVTAVFTALNVFGLVDRFDFVHVSRFITKRKLQHVYRRLMRSLKLIYKDKIALKASNVYLKYKSSRYYKISVHQNLKCLATT